MNCYSDKHFLPLFTYKTANSVNFAVNFAIILRVRFLDLENILRMRNLKKS